MDFNLWELRRAKVAEIITETGVSSIVDFGCGEGNLITYLINYFHLSGHHVKSIIGIDISTSQLSIANRNIEDTLLTLKNQQIRRIISSGSRLIKKKPKYFFPNRYTYPIVKLICGSIIDNQDIFLLSAFNETKCQMLCALEVMEHIQYNQLGLMFDTLLNFYSPERVIISTPNKEYNHIYGLNENQLRHSDHKFELSRKEFKLICTEKAILYEYTVEFFNIGTEIEIIGAPTQMALFQKIKCKEEDKSEYEYVFHKEITLTQEDRCIHVFDVNQEIYQFIKLTKNEMPKLILNQLLQDYTQLECLSNYSNHHLGFSAEKIFECDYNFKKSFANVRSFKKFILKYRHSLKTFGWRVIRTQKDIMIFYEKRSDKSF